MKAVFVESERRVGQRPTAATISNALKATSSGAASFLVEVLILSMWPDSECLLKASRVQFHPGPGDEAC